MKKRIFIIISLLIICISVLSSCNNSQANWDFDTYRGAIYIVGEQSDIVYGAQSDALEYRVTETNVGREDEKVHRSDIALINGNRITMLKTGKYTLWTIAEDIKNTNSNQIWGVDLKELKSQKMTGNEFETTLFFQNEVKQCEAFPFVVINKNITDQTLNIRTSHLDPYKGAPSIAIYTIIDDYKLYIGNVREQLPTLGNYTHEPNQESRVLDSYASIISRYSVIRISDGKRVDEDDAVLAKLGFESNLYHIYHKQNKKNREKLWAELKIKYNNDLSDPDYNREWSEIYKANPIYNPLYSNIYAPKGSYRIELSDGQIIENAFRIA